MAILLPDDPSHESEGEGEVEGGSWYHIRKEIEENSPSKRDGIDLKRENYLRKSYCTFLQDLGIRLKVPQVTIATAIMFCHRFYLRQSHAKSDRRTIATVCMFLAGKVEETPRPLKDVILVSYEIIHKEDPEAVQRIKQKDVYEKQKELITLGEKVVLATLGFDLYVLNPYKPLVEAIKKFKVAQNALAQVAWNFVNDGLRTSLCLQFKPHHIAAGAIFLAGKFLKVKLPSDGEKVWWQEIDVTPHQLEEVSNQMLELYEQNQVPPSQGSEVDGSARAGATHLAPSSNEERATSTSRSGTSKPAFFKSVSEQPFADTHKGPPRTTQSRSNDYGTAEMRSASDQNAYGEYKDNHYPEPETLPYQNNEEAQNTSRFGSDVLGEEQRNVLRSETREVGEFKDKHSGQNLDYRENKFSQSPQEAIKKIDRDKVKAALEKRKKFRGDFTQKTDLMDDDDLIERELEGGIELAAETEKNKEDRRQSWSKSSDRQEYENLHHGKHQKDSADGHRHIMKGQLSHRPDVENVEEGQVSVPDETGRGIRSPKSSNRKRKGGSPPVKVAEGRQRHNYGPGSHHYNHDHYVDDRNRVRRLGYMERDHKRNAPENHV